MAFQRSYSKVWWGSRDEKLPFGPSIYYGSISEKQFKTIGNLSKIHETDENSKLWNSLHESPGSLRSQDSGFSDNEDTTNLRQSNRTSKKSLNSIPVTPVSVKSTTTPPTVIRRNKSELITSTSPNFQRRSLSAPSSPVSFTRDCDIINQINRISLVTNSVMTAKSKSDCKCLNSSSQRAEITRKRRVSNLKVRRSLITADVETSQPSSDDELKAYNNETVYLGVGGDVAWQDDNNNKPALDGKEDSYEEHNNSSSMLREHNRSLFNVVSTSTPKAMKAKRNELDFPYCDMHTISMVSPKGGITIPYYMEYENPRLNGHALSVQHWLDDIRMSYNHEVMSTLQTKSIAQEAFRNLKITTATVAKIVRQLQTRALILQGEFERVEKIMRGELEGSFRDALVAAKDLVDSVDSFTKVLERRSVFFAECQQDSRKFHDNIDQMKIIVRDLNISLGKSHYLEADALREDIEVLKRYTLITLRLVFEKLIRVIVSNIENCQCDLVLRANLNMVATLSNIDYTGFASLNDAFLKNNAIRVFLLICLDSKFSSVRALSLRALATVCSSRESIKQFGDAGGVEIVKDILSEDSRSFKRTEPERREAVSLFTQITAPWHGSEHTVAGLKDCAESIVESLTDIVETTICCQTLLLCAASLNNLSYLETTSIYSIMSNETIIKLKEAVEKRGPGVSIFLYEQIMGMLFNMSANKKCHGHLANRTIITFITSTFQSLFYEKYKSRAETEAHRKTIKTILHIMSRLIHDSVVGQEILEHNFVPIFSKIERDLHVDNEYSRDISFVSRQMNESLSQKSFNRSIDSRLLDSPRAGHKLYFTRQESYV